MARGFNSTSVTESEKSFNSIATLVEVLVDPSDPAYLTDFARNISHDSKTWLSAQGLLSVSSITENANNGIEQCSITLSGVPDTFVKLFLDYAYIDRSIKVHKVFLDNDGAIVGNSVLFFDGRVDRPIIKHDFENEIATVSLTLSSHWTDFNRRNGRYTNDASQQDHFSGDDCFQYAIDYEKEITWGQA
jgi:hypothetical protein